MPTPGATHPRPVRPESTYRLQLHAGFTFRDATAIVEYLRDLGITHCYASPYLKARPGSTHGYDVIDHNSLNPEIGTEADHDAWVAALSNAGMSQILDIVPNHVGVGTDDNAWWYDVLEDGIESPYAQSFDIAWHDPPDELLTGKVLLPVLGEPLQQVLKKCELRLGFRDGELSVRYYERQFPLALRSYEPILREALSGLPETNTPEALLKVIYEVHRLHDGGRGIDAKSRLAARRDIKARLASLAAAQPAVQQAIERLLEAINAKPERLEALLGAQHYSLAYWRLAPREINYRRFFEINDLAALRMERADVFAAVHALVLRWIAEVKVTGLRIDHPDGLRDPEKYLRRLHAAADRPDEPLYVVVEKILAADETLPPAWPVDGTSGYDFIANLNALFVDPVSEPAFDLLYGRWRAQEPGSFADEAYRAKTQLLHESFAAELTMLARRLDRIAQTYQRDRELTHKKLIDALVQLIVCFPIYRTYITTGAVAAEDVARIDEAIREAVRRDPALNIEAIDFIRDLLVTPVSHAQPPDVNEARLEFVSRFQQLTAPVTAKGVEDTAFYRFNRLVSLNEVGGDPGRFGAPPKALHAYFADRRGRWARALSPLSTHDTKRSEDVRARLNVLSEMPDEWARHVERWRQLNAPHRQMIDGTAVPSANDEFLLYQTLLGAWPLAMNDAKQRRAFVERVQAYMRKALREAKVHTCWTDPNERYESAVSEFVARILRRETGGGFLADCEPFQKRISHFGLLNSLAQTLIRLTAPGVPDTYQGTELWDFSLVDPDNRRPVDYSVRQQMLRELSERLDGETDRAALARALVDEKEDGRVKLFVTWQSLQCRRNRPGLFSEGQYVPLEVDGPLCDHVFAFLRRQGERHALVVVPRFMSRLVNSPNGLPIGLDVWGETTVRLPEPEAGRSFRQIFTDKCVTPSDRDLAVAELLADFPVGLLVEG